MLILLLLSEQHNSPQIKSIYILFTAIDIRELYIWLRFTFCLAGLHQKKNSLRKEGESRECKDFSLLFVIRIVKICV